MGIFLSYRDNRYISLRNIIDASYIHEISDLTHDLLWLTPPSLSSLPKLVEAYFPTSLIDKKFSSIWFLWSIVHANGIFSQIDEYRNIVENDIVIIDVDVTPNQCKLVEE